LKLPLPHAAQHGGREALLKNIHYVGIVDNESGGLSHITLVLHQDEPRPNAEIKQAITMALTPFFGSAGSIG